MTAEAKRTIMAHTCHALGCETEVEPRLFMCYRHWSMIPKAKQRELWAAYREGQEISKTPSARYLNVARRLHVYVADAEGAPVPPAMRHLILNED